MDTLSESSSIAPAAANKGGGACFTWMTHDNLARVHGIYLTGFDLSPQDKIFF